MATIVEFKRTLTGNPDVAKMIMPSSRNEIFFDFDGEGKIDFAYLDCNGDNKVDTFAIDMTGDGSLDVYFTDTDGNGIADAIQFYPDGSDVPTMAFADQRFEKEWKGFQDTLMEAMESLDAKQIVDTVKKVREDIRKHGEAIQSNGTLGKLRTAIKSDPEMSKFICPSACNEIYLDIDGDGKADFGFIANGGGNYPDTFAVDLGSDGEFDLYLTDTDRNGLPDFVTYFEDGVDGPAYTSGKPSKEIEDVVAPAVEKITAALRAEWNAEAFTSAIKAFKEEVISALKAFQEANS